MSVSPTWNYCILQDPPMSVVSNFNIAILSDSRFFCLGQHIESLGRNSPCTCSNENMRVHILNYICSGPSFQGNKGLLIYLKKNELMNRSQPVINLDSKSNSSVESKKCPCTVIFAQRNPDALAAGSWADIS